MTKKWMAAFAAAMIMMSVWLFFPVETDAAGLDRELINLYPSQSCRITVKNTAHEYSFRTTDETIAVVDDKGIVTALSVGSCEIICELGTGETDSCTVNVKSGSPPTGVALSQTSAALIRGDKLTLKAAVYPSDFADDYLYFESSDETVATVSQSGEVTALAPGISVITVESASSAISASCLVKVFSESGHNDFGSELNGVLYNTSGERLSYTLIELKNSTSAVKVTTDSEGKFRFQNKDKGSYVLTVFSGTEDSDSVSSNITISSSNVKMTCIAADSGITVLYGTSVSTGMSIRDIELNNYTVKLFSGDNYDITYTLTPADLSDAKVIFTSSDESVASVDKNGRVTAINEGNAAIYVSGADGKVMKKCIVYVTQGGLGNFGWAIILMQLLIIILIGIAAVYFKEKGRINGKEGQ
ncbi:MAG: Ig-like domain-containing protein [Clostridia bacterium]|nr:Ig-like domain-containing protein [Clostridia bacterium]